MKPFILRYAKTHPVSPDEHHSRVKYSVQTESSMLVCDSSLVIDHPDQSLNSAGTTITLAPIDPTRDESTDR